VVDCGPNCGHIDAVAAEWNTFRFEQRSGSTFMARRRGAVDVNDSPPRHIIIEQCHDAAGLPGADPERLSDLSVGGNATGRDHHHECAHFRRELPAHARADSG
jgi:hypothetical protein